MVPGDFLWRPYGSGSTWGGQGVVGGTETGSEDSGNNAHVAMVTSVSCSRRGCQVVEWKAAVEAKTSITHLIISCSGSLYNIPDDVGSGVKGYSKS